MWHPSLSDSLYIWVWVGEMVLSTVHLGLGSLLGCKINTISVCDLSSWPGARGQ